MCWLGSTGLLGTGSQKHSLVVARTLQLIGGSTEELSRVAPSPPLPPRLPFSEQQILFFRNIISIFHKYKAITPPDLHYPPNYCPHPLFFKFLDSSLQLLASVTSGKSLLQESFQKKATSPINNARTAGTISPYNWPEQSVIAGEVNGVWVLLDVIWIPF